MAEGVLTALAASTLDAPTLAALPVLGCDGLPDVGPLTWVGSRVRSPFP
jgi:hypothetical protein